MAATFDSDDLKEPEIPSDSAWAFLRKHGKSIRKVDSGFSTSQAFFDLLPNLAELTFTMVCLPQGDTVSRTVPRLCFIDS